VITQYLAKLESDIGVNSTPKVYSAATGSLPATTFEQAADVEPPLEACARSYEGGKACFVSPASPAISKRLFRPF